MFIYLSGCVSKGENQGLFEYQLKKSSYKSWNCANEPQSYLKIQFSWNNPYLECFYLGIQGGSAGMNNVFGIPLTFLTWDSKVTSTHRPFWEHQSDENVKIMTWIQDSPILADLCRIQFCRCYVHWILYKMHWTYTIIYIVYGLLCTLQAVQNTLNIHYTIYSLRVRCALYTVSFTKYTIAPPLPAWTSRN